MLNVNSVRKQVLKSGSLTAAVGTNTVYSGSQSKYAKKRELNIIITSSGHNNVMIRQIPLFDQEDLDVMRSDRDRNKYLHIGCVTISIEPLLHQRYITKFGSDIHGHCALIDSTFKDLEESIISVHKYGLEKGRSDYVSYPNHCLSLSDPHIQKRLSIILGIKGVNVEPGVELFSVCIGYIVSAVNTLHPTDTRGIHNVPILGTEDATNETLEGKDLAEIEKKYNNTNIISLPSDDDIYYKSRGGIWGTVTGGGKTIKKRTIRTLCSEPLTKSLTRSASSRHNADKVLRVLKNKQIQNKLTEQAEACRQSIS
ncbi:TPA_asm: P3 [Primula alphacytorhabdovirus 1]|nr:TPA_asm: P3 [Primula alphacytorhabdovirus 1]